MLTVNVTLAFICLCDEQVGHVPSNVIFVTYGVAPENLLEPGKSSQNRMTKEAKGGNTFLHSQVLGHNSVS